MKKYIKMSECKDCQPDLQIPHKIIAIILLQYAENNLNNLNTMSGSFKQSYKDHLFIMFKQSFQNLGKFCNVLSYKNRLNYTWKYLGYYKKNHIIYYDMLIVQSVIRLLPERAKEIEDFIINII